MPVSQGITVELDCMEITPREKVKTRYQLTFNQEFVQAEGQKQPKYYNKRKDEMSEFNEAFLRARGMTRKIVKVRKY